MGIQNTVKKADQKNIVTNHPELAHKIANPLPEFKPQVEQAKVEQQYGSAKAIEVTAAQAAVNKAQANANTAKLSAQAAEAAREAAKKDLDKATEAANKAEVLAIANPAARADANKAEDERKEVEKAFDEANLQAGIARLAANEAAAKLLVVQKAAADATTALTPADANAKRLEAEAAVGDVAKELGKANAAAGEATTQAGHAQTAAGAVNGTYQAAIVADEPEKLIKIAAARAAAAQAQANAVSAEKRAKDAEKARDAAKKDLDKATEAADKAKTLAAANADTRIQTAAATAEGKRVQAETANGIVIAKATAAREAADKAAEKALVAQKAVNDAADPVKTPTSIEAEAKKLEAEEAERDVATKQGEADTAAGEATTQEGYAHTAADEAEAQYNAADLIANPPGGGTGGGSTYTYTPLNDTELKQVAKFIYDADHHKGIYEQATKNLGNINTSASPTVLRSDAVKLDAYIKTDSKLDGIGDIQCLNPLFNLSKYDKASKYDASSPTPNANVDANGDYCALGGELIDRSSGNLKMHVFQVWINQILKPNPMLKTVTNPWSMKPVDDKEKYYCQAVTFAKDKTIAIAPQEYLKDALGQFCDPTSIDSASGSSYTSTYPEAASVLCSGFDFTSYSSISC